MTMREKIMHALIFFILAIPAIPPTFLPVFQPYTFGKTILFEIVVELMLCIWFCIPAKSLQNPTKSDFVGNSRIRRAIFFMLCAFLISTALSINFLESFWGSSARMDGLFTLLHFVAFFFVLTAMAKEERVWEKYMRWSVGISACTALYGIAQWFGMPFTASSNGEIFSTLGNPGYFATYLLFHAFISLHLLHNAQSKEIKTIFFLTAAFAIITILLTQVMAVFLALIVGLFTALSYEKKIIMVFAGIFLFLLLISPSFQKLSPLDKGNALAMQSRLRVWRIAASATLEKPFFGHGANQFERAFLRYKSIGYPVPSTGETFDKPHNGFLEIVFSYGILGLCAYLYLLWIAFERIGKMANANEQKIFRGALAAYCISLFFLFETFSSFLLFFFLLAFFTFGGTTSDRRRSYLRMYLETEFPSKKIACSLLFVIFFFTFHFRPLYSAYFARQFFIYADREGTANKTLKYKATSYDSFNRPFIARAILITEKNMKR